jgi:hypothetical protein
MPSAGNALGGRLSPRTHQGICALQSFCALSHAGFGNPSVPLGVSFTRITHVLEADVLKGEAMTNIVKAHQHFASAVESLACGAGPIQERLCEAAGHIANVEAADIPEDLRDRFATIGQGLSSGGTPHEGKLSDSDAASTARLILGLKDQLSNRTSLPRRMG